LELTETERSVLRAVCDTIFPSLDDDSPFYRRSASDLGVDALLAEAVQSSLQPGSARDFRKVLSAIDSPLYNLLLTGRPNRFSALEPEERECYLASWRDSPIPLKRTAFQALKRLTCFLAYAATDASGSNPNWVDIGYPGPSRDKPVPIPESLRVSPIKVESDLRLQCDVVVVGSGAGGSVNAETLADAGFDVIVVEQGPYETSETFEQNELMMMQKLFQQSGTAATKDLAFVLLAGRGAGGGTTVNWNTCLKASPRVLSEWETDFGIDGITGPGFASYLDEVWRAVRVNKEESQRNGNNQVLWEGCRALGYVEGIDYHVIERNAVGCNQRCDFCTYGCIYACKQSTAVTYLPLAQSRGARFLFDTRVERITIENGSARGIVGVHRAGEKAHAVEVSAKAVVAACGGIETPALLLRSGVRDRNVGRYLRLHPVVALFAYFDRPIERWRGPPQTVAVWKFIDLDGTYHGFWVEAIPAHPGLSALGIPWQSGRQHKDFMKRYYAKSSASIVLLRERSSGEVAIDREGNPVVTYDLEWKDRETLVKGMEETARILAAAGAYSIWTTHNEPVLVGDGERRISEAQLDTFSALVRSKGIGYNRLILGSAHLLGSCRMSMNPSLGPTSPSGELHTVRNLFVGDACVFPTAPGVNPMISIMAMARRTAESIKTALVGRN
jgi:choline dehydrogenase-like flavoprotein